MGGYNLAPSWYILVQSNHPCWWLRQAPASNIFKSWGKQNPNLMVSEILNITKSYGFLWLPRYLTLLNYLNWKARFIFNVNPTWAQKIAWNLHWTTWKADVQALVPLLMVYPIDLGELAIVTTGHNMSAVTWLPVFMGSNLGPLKIPPVGAAWGSSHVGRYAMICLCSMSKSHWIHDKRQVYVNPYYKCVKLGLQEHM